jgi:hypothetical protein
VALEMLGETNRLASQQMFQKSGRDKFDRTCGYEQQSNGGDIALPKLWNQNRKE